MKHYVQQIIKGFCIFVVLIFTINVILYVSMLLKTITIVNENAENYNQEINTLIEDIKN